MELVISFSGGKDSCAMLHYLCSKYPNIKKSVVFADTGWEHKDALAWATTIVSRYGLPLHIVRNPNKDFISMVHKRRKFPAAATRQCTSDLKRGPIETWIRRNCTDKVVINCMGLRAEESSSRSKRPPLRRNNTMTNSKRTVWDWLPIKDWRTQQVFDYLATNNIPLHPVYRYLKRFSCRICIFMQKQELLQVRKNDPEAFETIARLERKINFSMRPDFYLDQLDEALAPPGVAQLTLFDQ